MVALKLVVVLVALAANSALAKPWGLDLPNPVASLSNAVKGAANTAEEIKAAAKGAAEGAAKGALSNLSGVSAIPSIPTELPKVPGMDSLPKVPGMDSLPKIPGMDSLPKIPGMDALSKIPGMDKIPTDLLNKIPSFSMPSLGDLSSKLSSMMSPWNLMMKAFCLKYPKVCEVFTSAKGKAKEIIGEANGYFQQALEKLSWEETVSAIKSVADSVAKKVDNPIYHVVGEVKKAVDDGVIDKTTAVKLIVQAIRDGVYKMDFGDDESGALTYTLKKSVEANIITQEQADKLREHAKNSNKDANVEVNVNVNKGSDNKEEAASGNKEEATTNVEVNVDVNSQQ